TTKTTQRLRKALTSLGPTDTEQKRRKSAANRKCTRLGEGVHPDEVDDTQSEEKSDTGKNMAIFFNVLRQKKHMGLENFVLNKRSFADLREIVCSIFLG
ncbi:hypothetical protein CARUB_v10003112mg, partial [Capsella rubella]